MEAVKGAVRRRLVARAGGIDLTQMHRVPDRLSWPLDRHLADPVARIGELRAQDPVSKLVTFMGMDIWLVTGDAEAREVLGDLTSYSTDVRPYYGKSGADNGDIGGLGFTDPPEHTRLRKLLTPEFTMRRLARLKPAIDRIIEHQLDETEQVAAENDGVVDLAKTFAFPIPFSVICELLGLRDEDRETFRALGSARFDVTIGRAAIMLFWGFIIASVVNVFLANTALDWVITYGVLVLFIAITAYQTQRLRQIAVELSDNPEMAHRYAIVGSLVLYIAFINLFLSILRILGNSRR